MILFNGKPTLNVHCLYSFFFLFFFFFFLTSNRVVLVRGASNRPLLNGLIRPVIMMSLRPRAISGVEIRGPQTLRPLLDGPPSVTHLHVPSYLSPGSHKIMPCLLGKICGICSPQVQCVMLHQGVVKKK